MSERPGEGEEPLLERLRAATAGDELVQELRRRYEALRTDYEALLGRLTDLERGLAGAEAVVTVDSGEGTLLDALLAPLVRVRDEYRQTAGELEKLVFALDRLAAGSWKGQREAAATPSRGPSVRRPVVQVDVKGRGFGDLLDFQERLSEIAGVARVSIHAIDTDRATFIVELGDSEPVG